MSNPLEKLDTCAIHVFHNFDELTVVLPLVVFVDVDGGDHDAKSGSNLLKRVQYCTKSKP